MFGKRQMLYQFLRKDQEISPVILDQFNSHTCIAACKLVEHIIVVLSNINQHLNASINPKQHGFRQGLSCTTQLVTTVDDIMKMVDKNISVHAAVLDFSKAFDRVPHDLLVEKLLLMGIDSSIVKWIEIF